MKLLKKSQVRSNAKERVAAYEELISVKHEMNSRISLIQQLIPIGLLAIEEELQAEVERLSGKPYSRGGEVKRWGSNPGSAFLGDQKVSIRVHRVRDLKRKTEIELESYQELQSPNLINEQMLANVINGISTRKYEKAALSVPETFGINKSSVSRHFIKESSKKMKEFNERDLSNEDIIAVFMDGKSFADHQIILALGVTMEGKKIVLGMVETSTENHTVCYEFIKGLKNRGLNDELKILFIIDGSTGLHKGIKKAYGKQAIIQRCQWHKRENVMSYLSKKEQEQFRNKLQKAYGKPSYSAAKRCLISIGKELKLLNLSAYNSLNEGLEQTLTLHRLGVYNKLGTSFKTTNCIESVNSQLEYYTQRVTYWKNSNQRQRWVATAILEIEPKLRKVKGYKFLPLLREAMEKESQSNLAKKIA